MEALRDLLTGAGLNAIVYSTHPHHLRDGPAILLALAARFRQAEAPSLGSGNSTPPPAPTDTNVVPMPSMGKSNEHDPLSVRRKSNKWTATRGRCFPVCAAALRPAQAGPASHHRFLARSAAAWMGARWDQAPHVATRTRLSIAALLTRLLRNAGTFENWCGKRASCSSR
jgi:hypothetical protein